MMGRRAKTILAAALLSRLTLSPFFGHPWDMYIWLKSGELALSQINIYLLQDPVDYPWGFYAYPPAWLYWLMLVAFANLKYLELQVFLVKVPIILSDIGVGVLVYRLAGMMGFPERRRIVAMSVWLFNPVSFFMSSIWGMFDSIAVLFMLLGLEAIIKGKLERAGALIGAGAAVKLLPALLIPPTIAYLIKSGKMSFQQAVKKLIIPTLLVFTLISTPFLSTPIEYLKRLFQHAKSVGSFTYWSILSNVVNVSNFWFISLIAFIILIAVAYKEMGGEVKDYVKGTAATVAAFLATSPKVNLQYTLTLIPLLLMFSGFWEDKRVKNKFVILMVLAAVWLASSSTVFANYRLDYLGRIFIPDTYEFGVGGVLMVATAVLGGTWLVSMTLDLIGFKNISTKILSKWSIIGILIIFSVIMAVFPTPMGVTLPKCEFRIAVPESVDAAFIPRSEASIDYFLKHYDVNYVVAAFSPDFINTYTGFKEDEDITKYLRFKTGASDWKKGDLKWLIRELHQRNVKILLGVYLKAERVKHHYGVHGFSIDWITDHPQLIGARNVLLFNSSLTIGGEKEVPYADYFAERVKHMVDDMGFDGVYLMDWSDWRNSDDLAHIISLLESLSSRLDEPLFVESFDTTSSPKHILILLNHSNYVIIKTAPWVNSIYYARMDNVTLTDYENYLKRVLETVPGDGRGRILFSVYVLDFVDGWATPAAEVQVEANEFYSLGIRAGYAIYYASRYVPYKITISESRAMMWQEKRDVANYSSGILRHFAT